MPRARSRFSSRPTLVLRRQRSSARVCGSPLLNICNFVTKANAARTKDAALVIEGDPRSKLHRFRFFDFVFEKAGTCRAVLDAEFLKLAFTRLVADRTIEWMIDQQKFHHALPAFLNQWRTCAHAHSFGDVLRTTDLWARHPIDDRLAVGAELGFAIRTHSRHAHLDQTQPANTR